MPEWMWLVSDTDNSSDNNMDTTISTESTTEVLPNLEIDNCITLKMLKINRFAYKNLKQKLFEIRWTIFTPCGKVVEWRCQKQTITDGNRGERKEC